MQSVDSHKLKRKRKTKKEKMMTTQLATIKPQELATQLASAQQRASTDDGDFQYMKFRKGTWEYGADDIEVEENSKWALHPQSFQEGFIAWSEDQELLGEQMKSMLDGAPILQAELPNVGGKWSKQLSVLMVCVSGEDEGVQAEFKSNSHGGKKELSRIIGEILKQLSADPKAYMPVVTLDSDDYKHKKYGKVFTPEMDIVEWRGLTDVDFDASEDTEAEAEEEEEETEEAATKKRRRIRS